MYPDRPQRSAYLDDAAKELGKIRDQLDKEYPRGDLRTSAVEKRHTLAKAWADLAAIEQGNLSPDVAADLVAAALKRLGLPSGGER